MEKGDKMKKIIIINRVLCEKCNDIVVSNSNHDFVSCHCGNISIDGGKYYLKRSWENDPNFIELSEQIEIPEDYKVDDNSLKQMDLYNCCCVCKSRDILVYKGEGEFIHGYDLLGYKCNNCKCLYIFNDINFKK